MNRCIDDIGLELHEEVVLACAAVDLKSFELNAGAFFHSCEDIACLECERLESCTDQVILVNTAGQACDSSACVRIPVRSAESCECRNNIASVRIRYTCCEVFGIRRTVDDLELIAQPLDRCTCYEDRTFKSILDLTVKTPCDCCKKSVVRIDRLLTDVHKHEASCSVCVLSHAGLEACLSEESSLLVTCNAGDLDRSAEEFRIGFTEDVAGRLCFRKHAHRNFELLAELLIPVACIDVEHECSGSVGVICCEYASLCQLVDKPGVNCTEAKLACLRSFTNALYVVEDPAKLRAGEIRVENKTCFVICGVCDIRILSDKLFLHISGSAALPYDCVIYRLSCLSVPYDCCLALVRDADRCNVFRLCIDFLHCLTGYGELSLPDFVCIMLYPAGLREELCELFLSDRAHLAFFIEEDTSVTGSTRIKCHYIFCHFFPPL